MFAKLKKGSIDLVEKTKQKFDPIDFSIKTKFKHIFYSYILVIIIFAIIYYILNTIENNGLMSIYTKQQIGSDLAGFLNTLYFSFVTATTSAYGDIAPIGISKVISMIEIITGLLMFGMLVSKIVSYKQDILLDELYNLSFEDKVNRMRSALYLFRTDSNKIIERLENGQITTKRLADANMLIISFESTIEDIEQLLCPKRKKEFVKELDELTLELVVNSLTLSLSKMTELVSTLKSKYGNEWASEKNISSISKIKTYCTKMQSYYQDQKLSESVMSKIRDVNKNIYELENAISSKDNLPKDKQIKLVN